MQDERHALKVTKSKSGYKIKPECLGNNDNKN